MMKHTGILLIIMVCATSATAQIKEIAKLNPRTGQDTGVWKSTLNIGVNFNQAGFSSNWKGGGTNSYAIGSLLNANTLYEYKRFSFAGLLDLQYGKQRFKGQDFRKTNDVMLADIKFARILSGDWNTYTGANFISQFDAGYKYEKDSLGVEQPLKISDFFAPAYLTIPVGVEYKPSDSLFVRFGVLAWRYTFVMDKEIRRNVPNNYGVDTNKTYLRQFGMQIAAGFIKNLTDRIGFKTNYFGFIDYSKVRAKDFVHRLDLTATAKITRYISTTFTGILLYDRQQDADVQISQGFTVGFLMKLGDVEGAE